MFGMFDWIWNLLYGISKSMFSIIDNLMSCANMLCGIVPIKYAGKETDFVSFLIRNENILYGFIGAVGVAIFLVIFFAVFAILRTIASEKSDKTPAQIFVNVGKTLLMFIFIPAAMILLIYFTNIIMQVLYNATTGGSNKGIGTFLAGAFGQNALKGGVPSDFYLNPDFDYTSTSQMRNYVNLDDYDFFFSWLASIVIIICLGSALLMFVDRAISIVILFIFSPISLSTSVLAGYGCIIAINIYALIIAAITKDSLQFFDNKILNNFMKILIIVGGGVSMQRVMALVGNLISAGAGSNELRDNAIATAGFRRAMGAGVSAMTAPFRATRSAVNFVRDSANNGFGTTVGRRLGFKTSRDYALENARLGPSGKPGSGAGNNKKDGGNPGGGSNVKNAILGGANPGGNARNNGGLGGGNNPGGNGGGGGNHNNAGGAGNNMVNNAINNALHNKNPGGNKK